MHVCVLLRVLHCHVNKVPLYISVTTTRPVAFNAQLTSDVTAIKNHQTLNFDKVMINLGNGYNGVSGVFAAPEPGLYVFHWVNTNRDRSYMNTELIVRNQVYGKAMSDAMDHDDLAVASNLAVVQLEPGDQVWVRSGTWHSGKVAGDYYSTFSGYRLIHFSHFFNKKLA